MYLYVLYVQVFKGSTRLVGRDNPTSSPWRKRFCVLAQQCWCAMAFLYLRAIALAVWKQKNALNYLQNLEEKGYMFYEKVLWGTFGLFLMNDIEGVKDSKFVLLGLCNF